MFQYQGPATKIIFGEGVASRLGTECAALGMRMVFLVTDRALADGPACQAARDSLDQAGLAVVCWADVVLDPTDRSVEAAATAYRQARADGIVALGGGSAMDTAKALGVLVAAGAAAIAPFYFGGPATPGGLPPLLCLPTTSGTGSEATYVAIVSDSANGKRKMLIRHPSLAPAVALVDPLLAATMPAGLTAATGMDALAHALEALTSTMASPISDALAIDAIPRVAHFLPRAVANGADREARAELSHAALVAGMAFLSGRVHLGHAVGHSLGAAYSLPHGLGCIVCMPAILEFLQDACAPQLTRAAAAWGLDSATQLPRAVADLLRSCGIPRLGAAIGADAEAIPLLVEHVQGEQRLIALSQRQPTADEWAALFAQSW